MYKFTILVEKEDEFYIAHNLELWVVSQWKNYEEAISNLQEATLLYLDGDDEKNNLKNIKNKNYSLTTLMV